MDGVVNTLRTRTPGLVVTSDTPVRFVPVREMLTEVPSLPVFGVEGVSIWLYEETIKWMLILRIARHLQGGAEHGAQLRSYTLWNIRISSRLYSATSLARLVHFASAMDLRPGIILNNHDVTPLLWK
jgi:hypothetical protein